MEACLAVEREQEKVVKKLKTVSGSASEKLKQVLDQIQVLKHQLSACKSLISLLIVYVYNPRHFTLQLLVMVS